MIESLACGTPVIAYPHGSVPEVIDDGETGFLVNSIESAVDAVTGITTIERHRCRQVFEERFTTERMATEYVGVYRDLLKMSRNSSASTTTNTSVDA
jgi:glycosyltransferase involved in cell wall biosynthesis